MRYLIVVLAVLCVCVQCVHVQPPVTAVYHDDGAPPDTAKARWSAADHLLLIFTMIGCTYAIIHVATDGEH